MNEDFAWFKENYQKFQREYGNAFLAIKNKSVIGVYKSYAEGVTETCKKHEVGTFIIQECNHQHAAYCCAIASMNFA